MRNFNKELEDAKNKVVDLCKERCLDSRETNVELIGKFHNNEFVGLEVRLNEEPHCTPILSEGNKEVTIFSLSYGWPHNDGSRLDDLRDTQFNCNEEYRNATEYNSLRELEEAYKDAEDEVTSKKLGTLLDMIKVAVKEVIKTAEADYISEKLDEAVEDFLKRYKVS